MTLLEKHDINPSTLGLLMFIKLNTSPTEYVAEIIRTRVFEFETDSGKHPAEILEEAGLIKYVKTGKKDPWYRIRLSDLGEKILKDLNNKPQHELAEFMLDYMKQEYARIGANGKIKGGEKLLTKISEFLYYKENYTDRMIKAVITSFVNSFQYDQTYMNAMDTLIFKPKNAYATKWTEEESPICRYIEKNQDDIKFYYKKLV